MNRKQRNDAFTQEIENDLRDRTSRVVVKEDECHRWDVRCYTDRCFRDNSPHYIGGTSSVHSFDKAMELAKFYAPCDRAIRVEVGVAT